MENRKTILIADDDPEIREVLKILLQAEGYQVRKACDGAEAVLLAEESVDLVILDVMMPGCSGIEACERIRAKSQVPILFLTAKGTEMDKVHGLTVGGDDYLVKPFSYMELTARVKALLRRYTQYGKEESGAALIRIQDVVVDPEKHRVTKKGREIDLTNIEYQILLLLASNRRKIFTVANIYESVWEQTYLPVSNNTVCVHIRKLRQKIEEDQDNPKILLNIWGRGYRIE